MLVVAVLGVGETGYDVVVGAIAGRFDVAAPAVSRVMVLGLWCRGCRGGVI